MKKHIDGMICFLAAIIPMNIIFIVRFIVNYCESIMWCEWIILSILFVLVISGILGHFALNTDAVKLTKHQLGDKYTIKEMDDLTGKQYLTQFALFILTAFAIPLTMPMIDFGFIIFVEIAIGIVYVNCKMFYINPLLNILGYKVYKATFNNHKSTINEVFYVFTKMTATELLNREIRIKHSDSKIIRIRAKSK